MLFINIMIRNARLILIVHLSNVFDRCRYWAIENENVYYVVCIM